MPLPNHLPDDFMSKVSKKPDLIGNRYSIVKRIGSGNFGTAFLIEDKDAVIEEEKKKVLKQICVGPLDPGETVDAMKEAKLLAQLKHKNIVQFHHSFLDGQFFCIVLEYCEGGDLECKIRASKKLNEIIPEDQVLRWMKQLLKAIGYMHERRVLHRDLKSRNIFLKDNQIKIGDFGISKILIGTSDKASTFVGTPYYMSPEVLNHEDYDEKCDIWSLGCVLYEICCCDHAFSGTSLMDVMMKIVSEYAPQLPDSYSRGLNNILQRMLDREVTRRQTAKQILSHPLFRKVETLPRNSHKLLSARDRLRIKKQKEADLKMQRLKEIAKLKYAENERIRKESQKRNFTRSSFDINMEVHEERSLKQPDRLTAISDDELHGTAVFQPFHEAAVTSQEQEPPIPMRDDVIANLDKIDDVILEGEISGEDCSLDLTDEMIQTLIEEGHIPEDENLADTLYSLHDDFESSSDESLPDDRVAMSDSEYKNMMEYMEDALNLEASVISKKNPLASSRFSAEKEMVQPVLSKRHLDSGDRLKNQTVGGVPRRKSRPIPENRPMTAVPPERHISHFNANMVEQRIANWRQRCLDGLGEELFEQAYKIAKQLRFDDLSQNTDTRKELNKLVSDRNKCMDLEQLVYLEKEAETDVA